jgi:uncharacterized protein Veg
MSIRMEIQWIVDDSHDPSKFKPYSSHGGSYQHRESKLVIASTWLGVSSFGSVKEHITLNEEEFVEIKESFERLKQAREQVIQAKVWSSVQVRFKKRAQAMYRFICDKAGVAHH